MIRIAVLTTVCLLLSACADDQSSAPQSGAAVATPNDEDTLVLGFDPASLSTTVRPQDDFWHYVNGSWIDSTEIPADRASYGTFHIINDRTEETVKALLEEASLEGGQLGDLYASYLDEGAAQAAGIDPLKPLFARIDAAEDSRQLVRLFGYLRKLDVTAPIASYNDNDAYDSTRLLVYLWQGGLGLPDRDYYLSDNEKLKEIRTAYQAHIEKYFELAGWPDGGARAEQILSLESRIAGLHWTSVQNRDRQQIYSNQYTFEKAEELTGSFPLGAWFDGVGITAPDKLVVAQTSYFEALGNLLDDTPMETWQAYLKFHTIRAFAEFLSTEIAQHDFEFRGRTLRGQEEQKARWRRAVRFVNRAAGELLGRRYVDRHFPESAKAEIDELVENLRKAFDVSIRELEWMQGETRTAALAKLQAFLPKLGYPDNWRDFSGLQVVRGNLAANAIAAREFNADYALSLLNVPADRNRWNINPQTVNAFYRPTHNTITFPAGILQSPMFDSAADPAANYGAIGSVIGHEFSHGFDDQGRKFDGQGLLRNWWTEEDASEYQRRAQVLVEQFNAFQPLEDTSINGELTLGENIGDLAGVLMAYRAFELSGHADGPKRGGLSPRQRFFVGYAVAFRSKLREPYLRELLLRDPHSPGQYRVMGALRNVPGFYSAFNVQNGDGMWLSPTQRAKIW